MKDIFLNTVLAIVFFVCTFIYWLPFLSIFLLAGTLLGIFVHSSAAWVTFIAVGVFTALKEWAEWDTNNGWFPIWMN